MTRRSYAGDSDIEDRPRRRRRKGGNPLLGLFLLFGIGLPLLGLGGFVVYKAVTAPKSKSSTPAASKNRERLLGRWEAVASQAPLRKILLDFRGDYRVVVTAHDGAGKSASDSASWHVVSDTGNQMTVRYHRLGPEPLTNEWAIEFVSDNQIRVTSSGRDVRTLVYDRKP